MDRYKKIAGFIIVVVLLCCFINNYVVTLPIGYIKSFYINNKEDLTYIAENYDVIKRIGITNNHVGIYPEDLPNAEKMFPDIYPKLKKIFKNGKMAYIIKEADPNYCEISFRFNTIKGIYLVYTKDIPKDYIDSQENGRIISSAKYEMIDTSWYILTIE